MCLILLPLPLVPLSIDEPDSSVAPHLAHLPLSFVNPVFPVQGSRPVPDSCRPLAEVDRPVIELHLLIVGSGSVKMLSIFHDLLVEDSLRLLGRRNQVRVQVVRVVEDSGRVARHRLRHLCFMYTESHSVGAFHHQNSFFPSRIVLLFCCPRGLLFEAFPRFLPFPGVT